MKHPRYSRDYTGVKDNYQYLCKVGIAEKVFRRMHQAQYGLEDLKT
jgi:hypothetical protein